MNKTLATIIIVVLAIAGIWYFVTQRDRVGPPETTQIKISDLPIVQGLPLYLALEKGYFEEVGLSVERVKFENPNQIIDALISGQVPVSAAAATGITGVAEAKNPDKLRIFYLTGGDDVVLNDAILVKNDSTISSLQELRGKKLGILPGIQWRTIARHILAKNNLTADEDVVLVELAPGLQAQALASGQIDALLGVEPIPTIVKLNGIGKEIVSFATVKYVANPFYGGAGVINLEFARQNPNTTSKILEVFGRAIKEIQQNPDAARQYLKDYTPLSEGLISKVPISIFKMYNKFDANDTKAVQDFYDVFSTYKVVEEKIDTQKVLYSPNSN